jgi:hypothetical protein
MRYIQAGAAGVFLVTLLVGADPSLAQRRSFSQGSPVLPLSGSAGPQYTVCIGSPCRFGHFKYPCYTTTLAAATSVCQQMWGGTPAYQTSSQYAGGQCGYINLNVSCPAQHRYNVCIGQYSGNCTVAGLYSGSLDYYWDCSFLYSHSNPAQVAASNICAAKGWNGGTGVTVATYSGNQCGYANIRVSCF